MLNGDLAKDPHAPEEDLSVVGASAGVDRTLTAMKGSTAQERRWVAMREKEKAGGDEESKEEEASFIPSCTSHY